MRQLTGHVINPANDKLSVTVLDEPAHGGACHTYRIAGFDSTTNPAAVDTANVQELVLMFQNGPINEAGVNGITHEALLEILIDRLRGFQSGPYACRENAVALTKLEEAAMWLGKRTRERMARGVEGTHKF